MQLRKVLRAKPGYDFFIQDFSGDERFQVTLVSYTDKDIFTNILWSEKAPQERKKIWMAIAFPNKQEKLELIVQKLTEIGISHLYLWAAERSQLNELKENKMQRLQKIMKEAMEQSRGWKIPQISIIQDLKSLQKEWNFVVFDLPKEGMKKEENPDRIYQNTLPFLWVIGPEGGLSFKDYEQFPEFYQVKSLWDTVLRMETAAIIGGRIVKNR